MERVSADPAPRDFRWFLKNQSFWFYIECDAEPGDEEGRLHSVCMRTTDGMFFVDHNRTPLGTVKVEVELQEGADLSGCHKFAALWTDPDYRVRACTIRGSGDGPACISVEFVRDLSPLVFWCTKQVAFIFGTWLRTSQSTAKVHWT